MNGFNTCNSYINHKNNNKNDSDNKSQNYQFKRIAKEFGISIKEAKEIFQPILF